MNIDIIEREGILVKIIDTSNGACSFQQTIKASSHKTSFTCIAYSDMNHMILLKFVDWNVLVLCLLNTIIKLEI